MVDNTFVHFLMVTALSMGAAFALAAAQQAWRRRRPPRQGIRPEDRAWLEVDLGALVHNARTLQRRLPEGCELMAVVKAEAYGHGAAVTAGVFARRRGCRRSRWPRWRRASRCAGPVYAGKS